MSLKENLKIMVVDDMAASRGLVINALQQIGFKNYTYETTGNDAFKTVSNSPVHLVISDYNMPGMTGLELLKSIREYKPTSRMGFILLSGSTDTTLLDRGRKLGMNNFLKKPFSPKDLQKCIEKVVGKL
jgi:two-component system chemotaxis response regulator CheY